MTSRTNLWHNLQLLALRQFALSNGGLQLLQYLGVKRGGAGNAHLDLSTVGAHQKPELLSDALERTEPVVFRECLKKVLEGFVLAAGALEELLDD